MWACGGAGSCCRWTDTDGSKERCEWNQNSGLTHTCTHMHTHMFTWSEEGLETEQTLNRAVRLDAALCPDSPAAVPVHVSSVPVCRGRWVTPDVVVCPGCSDSSLSCWMGPRLSISSQALSTVSVWLGLLWASFFFYIIQSSNTEGLCHLCKPASHTSLRTSVCLCCQSTSRRRFNTTLVVRLQCTHRSRLWGSAWATVKRIGVRPRVTARWRQPWLPCWYRDIIGVLSPSRDP